MKMNWPMFIWGEGMSMWLSSWIALMTTPFVLFCLSYPIMIGSCWLMSNQEINKRKVKIT
jgi:hypothetical protein